MKKIFNIADYPGKYVMHCDAEEKAKVFCDYLDSRGRHWDSGDPYTSHTYWGACTFESCYRFNDGDCGSKSYFESEDYTILEFDDFEFPINKSQSKNYGLPKVKNVIFNPPATIVFWSDGTKTVVKCDRCNRIHDCNTCIQGEYWKEHGLLNAFAKKAFGNEYFEAVKKYCE